MKHQKQRDLAPKFTMLVGFCILVAMLTSQTIIVHAAQAQQATPPNTEYFTSTTTTLPNGQSVDRYGIHGPAKSPAGFEAQRAAVTTLPKTAKTLAVPAYAWVFGNAAVSASMIAAYYDRNGYPNIYTGPTGGGVMPLDNSVWGVWWDGIDTRLNDPLTASHNGVDGRTIKGSIDDYWVQSGSSATDPYISGSWTQHAWGDAIGDYMKTSQSTYGNTDGNTWFYTWTTSAAPLTCTDMANNAVDTLDGTYGRKLFYEARGYSVTDCYNQKTDNNSGGFTFAMYKAEIDAGHPVMLNLVGSNIVGVGYDDATNTVYVHDTWDFATHSMTWGSSYSGMTLLSVSVVNLAPPVTQSFYSVGTQDGWVLESSETSNVGGSVNNTGNIYLGDSALKQQYRGILSFSTGSLPDTATIIGVTLRVRQQAIAGGGNPVTGFGGFMVDIKNGFLGTAATLQTGDFQAVASKTYGPFVTALSGGWYSINLTPGKAYINKLTTGSGLTQIRLRFNLDDNNNAIANILSLYSGNAAAAYRPVLIVTYFP